MAVAQRIQPYLHRSCFPQNSVPASVNHLIQQISITCLDLFGTSSSGRVLFQTGNLRTPPFSILGFASLLLGVSSSLMLLGFMAFMLGFFLMPLIFPAIVAGCVGAIHAALKQPVESLQTPSPLKKSISFSKIKEFVM